MLVGKSCRISRPEMRSFSRKMWSTLLVQVVMFSAVTLLPVEVVAAADIGCGLVRQRIKRREFRATGSIPILPE